MTKFIAKSGIEVTDEMIDAWEAEIEKGNYPGKPGPVVTHKEFGPIRRHFGRPRIYQEDLVPVTVRLPRSEVKTIKSMAKKEKKPFSAILRRLLERGLSHNYNTDRSE
jgi:hypothetical protein